MNALMQNKFWLIIIVALVVLVGLFVGLVVPQWTDRSKAEGSITSYNLELAKLDPPGNPDIEKYEAYRQKIIDGYDLITRHYTDRDNDLEQWFLGFATAPNRGTFMIKYSDEIKNIETALGQVGTKIGIKLDPDDPEEKPRFGFNWETPTQEHWATINQMGGTAAENAVLKALQKRFWARQRLANIIVDVNAEKPKAKVKVTRVVDFRFFKPLHRGLQNAPWDAPLQGSDKITYRSIGMTESGFGRVFSEYVLPNKLGTTLTFGFALDLPYSEVPRIIREMLNPATDSGPGGRILLNVTGTHVAIRDQNVPIIEFYYPERDIKEKAAKEQAAKDNVKPMDVRLAVTCQMIDFDPSKVTDWSKVQEAEGQPKP